MSYSIAHESEFMPGVGMSTSEMLRERFGLDDSASVTATVKAQLKELYKHNLLNLEKSYNYDRYKSKPLEESAFEAKPIVLVLGQSQTGKTTFIRHFLGQDYPGMANPTERFTVLTHDHISERIPGHVIQSDPSYPFQQLGSFGDTFLKQFELSKTNSDVLKDLWFVDTPGILSGAKQRGRGYKYAEVVKWFAERAQRIILIFDHHKMEINSEFETILNILRGQQFRPKIRVVLNKASELSEPELVQTYGALMWTLCAAFRTPEQMRVYISSFNGEGDQPLPEHNKCSPLFEKDASDLLEELVRLPQEDAINKMYSLKERAGQIKLHVQVLVMLKKRISSFMRKTKKKLDMVDTIPEHLTAIAKELAVPRGKIEYFATQAARDHLMTDHFSYKTDTKKAFEKLKNFSEIGIPRLMMELNGGAGADLEKDLVRLRLKKGKGIFARKRTDGQSKAMTLRRNDRAESVFSTQSKKSIFSVASRASQMLGRFRKGSSGSKLFKGRSKAGSRVFGTSSRRSRASKRTTSSMYEQEIDRDEMLSDHTDGSPLLENFNNQTEQIRMSKMLKDRNRARASKKI